MSSDLSRRLGGAPAAYRLDFLRRPAVRQDDLTVDPAAVGADQERHHAGDVVGLAEPAEGAARLGRLDLRFPPGSSTRGLPVMKSDVSTGPGDTALTVTRRAPSSFDAMRVRLSTAALVAA